MEERTAPVGHRIAKAMFVVVFFWFFWKFGGFLINLLIGRLYGEVALAKDVYTFTYKLVIFAVIYPSLLKVIVPAFMPLFTERLQRSEEEAWAFANTVTNLLVMLNVGLLCVGLLFTEKLVQTLAPGFDAETRRAATATLRVMFPGIFAMNLCVMALVIQNAYKVFSYPSAGDAVQKIVWAIAILVGSRFFGVRMEVIAYGFLAGCVCQILVNVVGLWPKRRFYRLRLPLLSARRLAVEGSTLAGFALAAWVFSAWVVPSSGVAFQRLGLDPEFVEFTGWLFLSGLFATQLWWRGRRRAGFMGRFAALAAPLLLGILFARWRDLTNAFFQSYTKAGWFGNLELAKTIGNLPHIMLGQALAIAMLPYLCELAAKKDWESFGGVLTSTLRMLALIFIPLTVGLCVLDRSIFQLIYDQGNWTEQDLMLGGAGLRFFVWGLVFFAIENALMQSFFSTQKVWWPTLLGIAAAVFHIVLMVGLVRWFEFDSPYEIYIVTAASLSASRAFKNLILLGVTRLHVPILPLRSSLVFAVKVTLISTGVWAAMHYPLMVTKKFTPLDGLGEHVVTVDTFNFETRGWFSRDADELAIEHTIAPGDELVVSGRVVPTRGRSESLQAVALAVGASGTVSLADAYKAWQVPGEAPSLPAAGLLLHQVRNSVVAALRTANVLSKAVYVHTKAYAARSAKNRHFLMVSYRVSGRRSLMVLPAIVPQVERDLSGLRISGLPTLRFQARVNGGGQRSRYEVILEDMGRTRAVAPVQFEHRLEWSDVTLRPADFDKASLGKLRRIILRDATPVGPQERLSKLLLIDDLAAEQDGRRVAIDDFEMAGAGWQGSKVVDRVPGEKADERALAVTGAGARLVRNLRGYDLAGCDVFSLKVKAEQAVTMTVQFADTGGRAVECKPTRLDKSEKRKRKRFPLSSLRSPDGAGLDVADLASVRIRMDGLRPGARVWVDNVEFSATRSLKVRGAFEAFKALRVLVPSFAGFVAFVLLVWALRVGEGKQVFDWFRAHGLDMVLSKIRRKKPADGQPADAEEQIPPEAPSDPGPTDE